MEPFCRTSVWEMLLWHSVLQTRVLRKLHSLALTADPRVLSEDDSVVTRTEHS